MRKIFANHLCEAMQRDARIVLVLADIGRYQFRACPQDRVIDVGISEQAAVDIAAGMAMAGLRPVVYGIAPFIVERAYEQIKIAAYNGAAITFVTCGASYDYGSEGATHHCPEDVGLLSFVPGMRVFIPGTGAEACRLFDKTHGRGINYLRLSDYENETSLPVNPGEIYTVRLYEDANVTMLAYGNMLDVVRLAVGERVVNLLYSVTWPVEYACNGKLRVISDFIAVGNMRSFAHGVVTREMLNEVVIKYVREELDK